MGTQSFWYDNKAWILTVLRVSWIIDKIAFPFHFLGNSEYLHQELAQEVQIFSEHSTPQASVTAVVDLLLLSLKVNAWNGKKGD
jgi:hypothetical protein